MLQIFCFWEYGYIVLWWYSEMYQRIYWPKKKRREWEQRVRVITNLFVWDLTALIKTSARLVSGFLTTKHPQKNNSFGSWQMFYTSIQCVIMKTMLVTFRIDKTDKKEMEKEVKRLNFDNISQLMRWLWRKYKNMEII